MSLRNNSLLFTFSWIFSRLPQQKQMLALSATYPSVLADQLALYMRNPTVVRLNVADPALLGKPRKFMSTQSYILFKSIVSVFV